MQVNPQVTFDGQCREAFRFYESCLGAHITFMTTYGDSPMAAQVPPEWGDRIMHATLELGGQVILTGGDAFPNDYRKPQGFGMQINLGDTQQAESVFHALAENGQVQMPLQETFWAKRFGMVTDRFGIPWMINCDGGS